MPVFGAFTVEADEGLDKVIVVQSGFIDSVPHVFVVGVSQVHGAAWLEVYAAPVSASNAEVFKFGVGVASSVREVHVMELSAVYF